MALAINTLHQMQDILKDILYWCYNLKFLKNLIHFGIFPVVNDQYRCFTICEILSSSSIDISKWLGLWLVPKHGLFHSFISHFLIGGGFLSAIIPLFKLIFCWSNHLLLDLPKQNHP